MQGRVYVTMRRPSVRHSVRLSVPSTAAATATGGFCRLADGRYRPTAVGALAAGSVQQAPALSSKRGQHHVGRG